MTLAIETILDKKPLRPRELEGRSEAEIKRQRDLVNIRWFLRHISIDMLGLHVHEMPERLHYYAVVMSDGLEAVVQSASFRLYDEELEDQLRSLHHDLRASLSFDHAYRDTSSTWLHVFGLLGPGRNLAKEAETAKEIRAIVGSLATTLGQVVSRIRHEYLEIDLDETSREFAQSYRKLVADVEKGFDD